MKTGMTGGVFGKKGKARVTGGILRQRGGNRKGNLTTVRLMAKEEKSVDGGEAETIESRANGTALDRTPQRNGSGPDSPTERLRAKLPNGTARRRTPTNQPKHPRGKTMADTPSKSKVAFVLLGVFFGSLGIHNFYIGRTKQGVIQLLISVLSGFTLSLASWIWAIVDICTINADANGVPLS